MNDLIESLLRGSIDLHMHAGPDSMEDPRLARRVDAWDAVAMAHAAGQAAIVLKSHNYPTAPQARILEPRFPGIRVLGGLALNEAVGGLNPYAVQHALELKTEMIWLPTVASVHHRRHNKDPRPGIPVFDDAGEPLPALIEIIDMIAASESILCTGHLHYDESLKVIRLAKERGARRVIATHPAARSLGAAPLEVLQEMARLGALLEFTFVPTTPAFIRDDPKDLVELTRAVGTDHCFLATDFGQYLNPPPSEGMRMMIATMLYKGMTPEEIEILVKRNPGSLIGIA